MRSRSQGVQLNFLKPARTLACAIVQYRAPDDEHKAHRTARWHHSTLKRANRSQGEPFLPFQRAVDDLATLDQVLEASR